MLYRIQHGEYGQDSERELMALKFNIIIRVYDGYSKCWIINQEADPNGHRVITIIWDRTYTHYNLLIPEGEDITKNRSRQIQNIISHCSLQVAHLPQIERQKDKSLSPKKNFEELNYDLKQINWDWDGDQDGVMCV